MVLDGQNMRLGISKDLSFSDEDRSENLRRTSEVAKLMNQSGLIFIASLVAPKEEVRQKAKGVIGEDNLLTIHLTAPDKVLMERDTEGHYKNRVKIDYEPPVDPDLVLETDNTSLADCVTQVIDLLNSKGILF